MTEVKNYGVPIPRVDLDTYENLFSTDDSHATVGVPALHLLELVQAYRYLVNEGTPRFLWAKDYP